MELPWLAWICRVAPVLQKWISVKSRILARHFYSPLSLLVRYDWYRIPTQHNPVTVVGNLNLFLPYFMTEH